MYAVIRGVECALGKVKAEQMEQGQGARVLEHDRQADVNFFFI